MMRLLLSHQFALVGVLARARLCSAVRFPPFSSLLNRVVTFRDEASAPSEDLVGLLSRKDRNELSRIFSYGGWRRDADEAEETQVWCTPGSGGSS